MADHADNRDFDFDELLAFVEIITRDALALEALRGGWDVR